MNSGKTYGGKTESSMSEIRQKPWIADLTSRSWDIVYYTLGGVYNNVPRLAVYRVLRGRLRQLWRPR